MPLTTGETFAGYRILRPLGSGGMGEVYLVQHPRLPRHEALKVLRPDISSDPSFRERFIREADLAAGLRHPSVVGIHDRGEHEGLLWIAMDYIEGSDAAELLRTRYPAGMPVGLVTSIVAAVASALDYAHNKGLLHRDVKPANIIVSDLDADEPHAFLADFGIARTIDDISGITTTNMTVGTVAYAAPEQLMGDPLDGSADQYALAATAYHLVTGALLFPHSNPAVVIGRHLNAPVPALAHVRPDLASLDEVFATALAKNRDNRFASCVGFSRAVAGQSHRDATNSRVMTVIAPTPRPVGDNPPAAPDAAVVQSVHSGALRRRWFPTVAVVLAALIGLLVWRPWESGPNELIGAPESPSESAAPQLGTKGSTSEQKKEPLLPPTVVGSLLLTAPEISNILGGIEVSGDPEDTYSSVLKLDSSSYGPSDHSREVDPAACADVVFTGEQAAYGKTDFEAMKTESFSPGPQAAGDEGPWQLQQTAAAFPSAASAASFLSKQLQQWTACSRPTDPPYPNFPDIDVAVLYGYENGRSFILGDAERTGDTIVVSMASNDPLWGAHACQQALGIRNNVVAEARSCRVPLNAASIDGLEPADPAWALPEAQRMVSAMLEKSV